MTAPFPFHNTSALTPYQGTWDLLRAGHLLRRTLFGPDQRQISWAVSHGMKATINTLLTNREMPAPPLHYKGDHEPQVSIGKTWISAPYQENIHVTQMACRSRSLFGWNMGLILDDAISIREKMVLFWHNHFALRAIEDPRYLYRFTTTIRQHATGNFRALIRSMTIDPSMLVFLNGNRNHQEAPNENYARELLELFTLGKGELAGPGDYTNYTEQDVKALARSLTGWQDIGFLATKVGQNPEAQFIPDRHDRESKQLSHRLNHQVILDQGMNEYQEVLEMLLDHPATAVNLCSRLYRWFVDAHIDEQTQQEVIQPLADIWRNSDYELTPTLQALFQSSHFYQINVMGTMLKNPLDLLTSLVRPLSITIPLPLSQRYDAWYRLFDLVRRLQMDWYELPQVAGWDAYYRAPLYYRHWLNAATLSPRMELVQRFLEEGYPAFEGNGPRMLLNPERLLDRSAWSEDVVLFTENITKILLPVPLSSTSIFELSHLLDGSRDSLTWKQLINHDDQESVLVILKERIGIIVKKLTTLPEFQLT